MPSSAPTSSPGASTVLDDLRALHARVVERIHELEPFEQELAELRQTAERLGIDVSAPKPQRAASSTRSPRGASSRRRGRAGAKPRRRRARQGSRAEQVIQLVGDRPGITVPQLGEALGVDSTGLYRVVRQLEAEGRLRKDGRELQPVAAASQADVGADDGDATS